jgi:transposase
MNLERTTKAAMHDRIRQLEAALAAREADLAAERDALAKAYAHASDVEKERDALRAAHERIRLELELIKRRIVLGKAERVDTQQLELEFAEKLAALNALADTPKDDTEQPPPNKKQKKKPKGRRDLKKAKLPVERIEVTDPVFEAMVAEGRAERINADESGRLGYKRGGPYVVIVARATYRLLRASGEPTLATAAMPRETFARSIATPSLMARIVAQKYAMGLPLYRLEEQLMREGARIDRGTMARWLADAGQTFGASIVDAMIKDAIANAFCIATDATGILIQPIPNEQRTRQPCKRGHIFTQVVDRDAIIFSYTDRETSQAVKALFKGFKGYIQADAKSVYDALFRPPDDASANADGQPTEVGCWSHGRRKFWEATVAKSVVAREGLARLGRIFELDNTWKDKPPAEIARLRQKHLAVHLTQFFTWASAEYDSVRHTRGLLTSALGYVVRQRGPLEEFLTNGRLVMTNNRSELALRSVATGRRAWLFCGSDDHAEAAANLMTLVASAKLHALDPESYLRDIIRVLAFWPRERLLELAPKVWAATRARLDAAELAREIGELTVPPLEEKVAAS